jgi:hypothetical protein
MKKDDVLLKKIEEILRPSFRDDTVDVSLSHFHDNIHVVVVSRKFDNMTEQQKQEHLWGLIDASSLTERQKRRISLILPTSPAELK